MRKAHDKKKDVKEGKKEDAHEYNLDAAQREIDRREAEGEDMSGAKIDPKTYKIIRPKKKEKTDEGDNPSTFEDIIRLSGAPVNENVTTDHTRHTFQHILNTYKRDIRDFVQYGAMTDHLFDALYDYYFDEMPYGTKKARTGDPHEWVSQRFDNDLRDHGMMDETVTTVSPTATPAFGNDPTPMSECNYTPLNEYCPVHGLEECNSGMFESELARIKSLSLLK